MAHICDLYEPDAEIVTDEDYAQLADDDRSPDPLWGDDDGYEWTGR